MRAMKDSGIEWIGQIPQNWNVGKLGFFIEAINGDRSSNYPSGNDLQDSGIPFLTSNNLESDILTLNDCKYISEDKYSVMSGLKVKIDDIIYCLRGSVGKCSINKSINEGTVASSLMGIRCTGMHPDYLLYILKSSIVETQNSLFMNGTCAANLSAENVSGYIVPVPDVHEQIKIANYLSKRCAELDALIAAKEKFNTLLKERRQSIIYEAVTKGLNPDAPMKDSGIEWIGQIPENWDTLRLRFLGAFQNGISKAGEFFGSGHPFVSYGDVYKNEVLPAVPIGLVESTEAEQELYSVQKGDVFFTRTSETKEEIGIVAVCKETIPNATFAGFLIRMRPTTNAVTTDFLRYYFSCGLQREYFSKEMTLVTRASLGQDLLKNMVVTIPTAEEQQEIVNYLDELTQAIDNIIASNDVSIQKLKEYRQSIIYEAVTGKIEL